MTSDYLQHAPKASTALERRMQRDERVIFLMRRKGMTIEGIHRAIVEGDRENDPMPDVTLGQVATVYREAARRRADDLSESREEARALAASRLDAVIRTHEPRMAEGNPKSTELYLRAVEAQAKLAGAYAPERHEHAHTGAVALGMFGDPAEIQAERDAQVAAGFKPAAIDGTAVEVRR